MDNRFVLGLDLGQSMDYTALCVLERMNDEDPPLLHCRHLERYELGTRYPAIVAKVQTLLNTSLLQGAALVLDNTGVGRAVTDLFLEAQLSPVPVTITSGDSISKVDGVWRVAKKHLVSSVVAPLQSQRLKFAAGMPLAPTLVEEMLNFKVKITAAANDTYASWREGIHDDLILAVMLAAWWAQRGAAKVTMASNPFYPSTEYNIDTPSKRPVHSQHDNTDAHRAWSRKNFCLECFNEFNSQEVQIGH